MRCYRCDDAIDVRQDIIVPETQHPIALVFEKAGALRVIGRGIGMLPAVGLDDQLGGMRAIVSEIVAHRNLATEFRMGKSFP